LDDPRLWTGRFENRILPKCLAIEAKATANATLSILTNCLAHFLELEAMLL
jgi:hypothetical protein